MSAKSQTKTESAHTDDQEVFNAAGVLMQFLVSPEEVQDAICLIRGIMPPSVIVPLHSHPEPEIIFVLEGSLEVFRAENAGRSGWTTVTARKVAVIPANVRHALRNPSAGPVTSALVTKSDPNEQPWPPKPEGVQVLAAASAKYGLWMGSPEENAAIGLHIL